ncbi:hypothetical protein SAMN04515647_2856 [Cohaesibacter sp. ES.047]|nr:hypothetical protein SAMN04515647_2856 [Cohaesibacter sp. ES.047]
MSKKQQRSNKEARKPKKDKTAKTADTSTFEKQMASSKPAGFPKKK